MFATLLGRLPRPPLPDDASTVEVVRTALEAQRDAGLEPLTDGGLWPADGDPAAGWQRTQALSDRAVKAVLTGPWTVAERGSDLEAATRATRDVIRALAVDGCPLIEIHEPAAVGLDGQAATAGRFAATHRRLIEGVAGTHLSLAITGGNADQAGIGAFVAAPYASLALDLVRGPDNWRLAAVLPASMGLVIGALTSEASGDESVEVLLWALGYAASTAGRGPARVGIAPAGDLDSVSWDVALRRMRLLGESVRLWQADPEERAAAVDPRAVSARSAALGRAGIRRRTANRD